VKFIKPDSAELAGLRADPLLWEQELDVHPDVAAGIERAVGFRAGRAYWRSASGYLYALELADLGRGVSSMVTVYGFWKRYEPRPVEYIIDIDLVDFLKWFAVAGGLNPADFELVVQFAQRQLGRIRLTP
jgi:hypothetical protein